MTFLRKPGPRFLVEATLIVVTAVLTLKSDARWWTIVAFVFGAWVLCALFELAVSQVALPSAAAAGPGARAGADDRRRRARPQRTPARGRRRAARARTQPDLAEDETVQRDVVVLREPPAPSPEPVTADAEPLRDGDLVPEPALADPALAADAAAEREPELEPAAAAEPELEVPPEPVPVLEAERDVEREPVVADEPVRTRTVEAEPEPVLAAEPESAREPEPAAEPARESDVAAEREPEVQSKPEPEPVPAASEPPVPSEPPAPVVATPAQPEPQPAEPPAPVPEPLAPAAAARTWNIWNLEQIVRDRAPDNEELNFLLMYLRDYANADGMLPSDFDGLVRESFGDLLLAETR